MLNAGKSTLKLTTAILLTLSLSNITYAKGDIKKGKAKAAICAACHGAKGISANDIWPNLAGQKFGYMVKQMKDFKSGARKDPLMTPQATSLSEEDIKNVAAYFSSLKPGK